jgi:hypothetical protein
MRPVAISSVRPSEPSLSISAKRHIPCGEDSARGLTGRDNPLQTLGVLWSSPKRLPGFGRIPSQDHNGCQPINWLYPRGRWRRTSPVRFERFMDSSIDQNFNPTRAFTRERPAGFLRYRRSPRMGEA